MEKIRQWYIVYTKAGQEQKVCEALRRKKIDSFYPVNKLKKISAGKERISFKPLIERYVFAHLSANETNVVNDASGTISFVHWLSKPIIIHGDDIYLLKRFFNMHDDIHLEKIKVNPAEPATIINYVSDNADIVSFLFPVLGYAMKATENRTRVKVITVSQHQTKTNLSNQYAEAR